MRQDLREKITAILDFLNEEDGIDVNAVFQLAGQLLIKAYENILKDKYTGEKDSNNSVLNAFTYKTAFDTWVNTMFLNRIADCNKDEKC